MPVARGALVPITLIDLGHNKASAGGKKQKRDAAKAGAMAGAWAGEANGPASESV